MDTEQRFRLPERPIDRTQVPAWARLHEAIEQADHHDEYVAEADLAQVLEDPDVDWARGSLAIYDGSVMAAFGQLTARTAAEPEHLMFLAGGVHPGYRNQGLGTRIMSWACQAARPLHDQRFPGRPLALAGRCRASDEGAAALFAATGFAPARWFLRMRCDLTAAAPPRSAALPAAALPAAAPPAEIARFTPDRSADARQVHDEAFRDHWGMVDSTPESWAHYLSSQAFRPQYSFLAYAGREPLGLVISHEYDSHAAATGRRDLYIPSVATRRAARRRGIATALLSRALEAARADGFATATLDVDADSPTGAVGVYERAGFSLRDTWITQVKQLTG